jgi:predicted porin
MGMGFDVFGGYSRDNANGTQKSLGLKTEEVWRVGAAWAWQNLKFMGQYEQIHHAIGSATCTTAAALVANPLAAGSSGQCNSAMNWGGNGSIWHAGGQYRWGNTTLVAQGGMTHADAGGINASAARKAQSFTVGAIHNLSKRTSIFGGYQHVYITNANGAGANNFDQYVAPDYATGKGRATYSIGLRHNF